MGIKRITLSVPEAIAARIKKAAGGTTVSAWVTDLIAERLDEAELERQWQAFCDEVPISRQEDRDAAALFKRLTKPARKRSAA